MSGEVEQVVNNFNELRAGNDFSAVAEQLRDLQRTDNAHWKSNLAQINSNVDMKELGFDEDFTLLGVNDKGKVLTNSADGQTFQIRDRTHLEVQSEQPNIKTVEQWGKREFTASPEGSASYAVKRGDNLWSIARDTLTEQLGHTPKNGEILAAVKDIARENGLKDPNKILAGQELMIPMPRPHGQLPQREKPNTSANAPEIQPQGELRNPLAAPGLGSDRPGDDDKAVNERNMVSRERSEGMTTTKYEGTLNDGLLGYFGTKYQSERTTGQNGELLSSRVDYEGSGANLNFADQWGNSQKINGVKSLETNFNSEAGTYETTITTAEGLEYRSVTRKDGQVVSMRQINYPGSSPAVLDSSD